LTIVSAFTLTRSWALPSIGHSKGYIAPSYGSRSYWEPWRFFVFNYFWLNIVYKAISCCLRGTRRALRSCSFSQLKVPYSFRSFWHLASASSPASALRIKYGIDPKQFPNNPALKSPPYLIVPFASSLSVDGQERVLEDWKLSISDGENLTSFVENFRDMASKTESKRIRE